MREILFRGMGYCEDNTLAMVYGYLVIEPEGTFIYGDLGYDMSDPFKFKVIPETVGQYIGVNGYVGKYEHRKINELKLFEDDIVEAMSQGSKGTFRIVFRQHGAPMWILYPAWQPKGEQNDFWSIAGSDIGREKGDYYDDLYVVGNAHENPELKEQYPKLFEWK